MSTPADFEQRLSDVERRARQHRDDVDALYGLVRDLDQKVTQGFTDVNGRLDSVNGQLDSVNGRMDSLETKVDQGFAAILAELRNRE